MTSEAAEDWRERAHRLALTCLYMVWAALLLLGTGITPAHGQAWPLMPASRPLNLAQPEEGMDVSSRFEILKDDSGRLNAKQALEQSGWEVLTPGEMANARRAGAIWLRATVSNPSQVALTRWLVVGSARLEKVDLLQFLPDGQLHSLLQSGIYRPLGLRPVQDRLSVFPLTLDPSQERTVVLRIESRNWVQLELRLWSPNAWLEARGSEELFLLLPVTIILTLALVLGLMTVPRWHPSILAMAAWLAAGALHELAHHGFLYKYVFPSGGELAVRMISAILMVARILGAVFVMRMLDIHRMPAWRWSVPAVSLVMGAVTAVIVWGDLAWGIHTGAIVQIVLLLFLLACILMACWRRHRYGVLALIGWMAVALVNLARFNPTDVSVPLAGLFMQSTVSYMIIVAMMMLYGVIHNFFHEKEREVAMREVLLEAQESDRKRLENAVRERTLALSIALNEAQDANRAKHDFLARISHDLRSPLTAIMGYAEVIIAAGRRDAESARIIKRSARHLLALLNDLIEYARGGNNQDIAPSPVYTTSLLQMIVAEGQALSKENNNAFEYSFAADLPAVIVVDAKRLHQVLLNIVSNAAKFTTDGMVRFSVALGQESAMGESSAVDFIFTIEDTGPGIPSHALHSIFEPFFRLSPMGRVQGLGLGLSIARHWVQRMGGVIQASSVEGRGTLMEVRIALQVATEDALSGETWSEEEADVPELDGQGRLLWVVEDSSVIRELLVGELRRRKFTVIAFADGAQVQKHMAGDPEPPELVLTDMHMPAGDGRSVLREVRRKWPALPVILLTAAPFSQEGNNFSDFSAVLQKPLSLQGLGAALANLLDLQAGTQAGSLEADAPPHTRGTDAPPAAAPVAAETLQQLREMVRHSAISDIIDWADHQASQDPGCRPFALHVRALAEKTDLQALARLCA